MVDIPERMGLCTLAKMEREVGDLLGVEVDLVPSRLVKAEVAASAKGSAVALRLAWTSSTSSTHSNTSQGFEST